jgi:hypothetical protein
MQDLVKKSVEQTQNASYEDFSYFNVSKNTENALMNGKLIWLSAVYEAYVS